MLRNASSAKLVCCDFTYSKIKMMKYYFSLTESWVYSWRHRSRQAWCPFFLPALLCDAWQALPSQQANESFPVKVLCVLRSYSELPPALTAAQKPIDTQQLEIYYYLLMFFSPLHVAQHKRKAVSRPW